jgi:hypothetical protein
MVLGEECTAWLREHVEVTGPVILAFERPWASVWRVPTATGQVWLKACAPVQAFEPHLTAALSVRWPDRLPEMIAHEPQHGWLLFADAGTRLGVGGDPQPWLALLPRYAELQRGEVAYVGDHLASGVPDRRLARFPTLYADMLERDLPFGMNGLRRLRAFESQFGELCAELAGAVIPETIQHDDLHGNNVYRRGAALRILDWGDSCISHPFLALRVTLVHLFLPPDDPWRLRLRDAYLRPWGEAADLSGTFGRALRLAPFAHLFVLVRLLDASGGDSLADDTPDLVSTVAECVEATA